MHDLIFILSFHRTFRFGKHFVVVEKKYQDPFFVKLIVILKEKNVRAQSSVEQKRTKTNNNFVELNLGLSLITLIRIHMTGTMTNPMSVDQRLRKDDRFSICPYLTLVRIMGPLLLYILNCSNTLTLNKNLAFMILRLLLVLVSY